MIQTPNDASFSRENLGELVNDGESQWNDIRKMFTNHRITLLGGFNLPLRKISLFVSWDDDSSQYMEIPNWMESHKSHVPNHQPVFICAYLAPIYVREWFENVTNHRITIVSSMISPVLPFPRLNDALNPNRDLLVPDDKHRHLPIGFWWDPQEWMV